MSPSPPDFNGDAVLDVAVAVTASATNTYLRILLGNGDGTFVVGSDTPVRSPVVLAAGDFNGDRLTDLAFTVQAMGFNGLGLILGNGDGTLGGAEYYSSRPTPTDLRIGDFDGDGFLDLASVSLNGVRVLFGNGDGSLRVPPVSYLAGSESARDAAADLDGDGWLDLAVSNSRSGDVSILLNDGDWRVGPAPQAGEGGRSWGWAADPLVELALTGLKRERQAR